MAGTGKFSLAFAEFTPWVVVLVGLAINSARRGAKAQTLARKKEENERSLNDVIQSLRDHVGELTHRCLCRFWPLSIHYEPFPTAPERQRVMDELETRDELKDELHDILVIARIAAVWEQAEHRIVQAIQRQAWGHVVLLPAGLYVGFLTSMTGLKLSHWSSGAVFACGGVAVLWQAVWIAVEVHASHIISKLRVKL